MPLVNALLFLIALISILGTFPNNFLPFLHEPRSIYGTPWFLLLLGLLVLATAFITAKRIADLVHASRQKWGSWGGILIHTGFLIVMLGGLLTFLFSDFRDVTIPEGEVIELPGTKAKVKLEKFAIVFHPGKDRVEEFNSRLLVEEKPGLIRHHDLRVNHPLKVQGTKLFQMSYQVVIDQVKLAVYRNQKTAGRILLKPRTRESFESGRSQFWVEANEIIPDFVMNAKGEVASRSPYFRNPGVLVSLYDAQESDHPVERQWVFQEAFFHSQDKPKGWTFILEGISRHYVSGIKLSRDSGVPVVYLGYLILILGTFISGFVVPRDWMIRFSEEHVKKGK